MQNDISALKVAFGALKAYRLYRREGLEVCWETGGESLTRSNETLLLLRARIGGKVVDASAFSYLEYAS